MVEDVLNEALDQRREAAPPLRCASHAIGADLVGPDLISALVWLASLWPPVLLIRENPPVGLRSIPDHGEQPGSLVCRFFEQYLSCVFGKREGFLIADLDPGVDLYPMGAIMDDPPRVGSLLEDSEGGKA